MRAAGAPADRAAAAATAARRATQRNSCALHISYLTHMLFNRNVPNVKCGMSSDLLYYREELQRMVLQKRVNRAVMFR